MINKESGMEEYTLVKVVTTSDIPETRLCGLVVGPAGEGKELEVSLWVAEELVKAGLARFRDELDIQTLTRVHWGELVQRGGALSKVPEDLYVRADLTFRRMRGEVRERALRLFREFLECRLRKIARLSVSEAPEAQLRNMTPEERRLYEALRTEVERWRGELLRFEV